MNSFPLSSKRGPNGEPYVMWGDKGMCYICSVELTSLQHCRQHVQGNKHINKEKNSSNRQHTIGNTLQSTMGNTLQPTMGNTFHPTMGNACQPTMGNTFQPTMGDTHPAVASPLTFPKETNVSRLLSNRGPNGEEYDIAGPGGRCFVCSVDFTSVELAKEHLAGQKHRKKAASHHSLQGVGGVLSGMVNSGQIVGHGASNIVSSGQTVGHDPSNIVHLGQTVGQGTSNVGNSGQTAGYFPPTGVSSHSPPLPSRGPNGQEFIMEENRGYCIVCRLELTSPSHAQSHLSGKKHKKKCLDGVSDNISVNRPDFPWNAGTNRAVMCSICNVVFSSVENAMQHFESERHKNKDRLIKLGIDGFSQEMQTALDPEQTKVVQVYQPSAQLAPLDSDSCLNELTRDQVKMRDSRSLDQISSESSRSPSMKASSTLAVDAARLPAGFSDNGIQLGDMSFKQTQDADSHPIYGQSDHDSRSPVLAGNNVTESCTTDIGLSSEEVSEATIKTEIEQQNIANPYTGARNKDILQKDNFSCKQNELSKVGNKRIEDHRIHDRAMESLTDNTLQQPIEESSTKSTFKYPLETEHLLSAEQNGTACIQPEASTEINEHHINSHMQQGVEVQQHQEHLHHSGSVKSDSNPVASFVGSGERFLENVLSVVRRSSLVSDTNTEAKAHILGPYYFDGCHGRCYCCSVELTSMQHANQHLNGQKHQKKLGQWELTQTLHVGSVARTDPFLSLSSAAHPPNNVSPEDDSYYFNGSKGFCHVCNIEFTSLQHTRQHINGKPHKRSQDRSCLSKKGVTYPLKCEICKKFFSGQESALQHFTSSKHKSKVDVMNDSVQVVMVIDDGRVIMKDGQTWYVCDVCSVPMNTKEQFLIHKDSPKHKKECENNKSRSTVSPNNVQNSTVPNAAQSDLIYGEMRAPGYQGDSKAMFGENGHTVDHHVQPKQINNLQLDCDKPHNQLESERLQVLDDNRHYLTYGQTPVISHNSYATTAASSQQLNEFPTRRYGIMTQVNDRLSSINKSYSNVKSELQDLGAGVNSAPSGQKSSLTVGHNSPISLGQNSIPPGQNSIPPGQNSIHPPGQNSIPPGQNSIPPGQNSIPPGQNLIHPPGQNLIHPPGQNSIPPPGQNSIPPPGQNSIHPPGQNSIPPGQNSIHPPGQNSIHPPGQNLIHPPGQNSIPPPGQNSIHPPGQNSIPPGQNSIQPPGQNLIHPPGQNLIHPPGQNLIQPPGQNSIHPPGQNLIQPPGQNSIHPPGHFLAHQYASISDPRLYFQQNQTESNLASSEYFSVHSHLPSSHETQESSQMYAYTWQHLVANSGDNAGFQTTSQRGSGSGSGLAAVAKSSIGSTEASRAAVTQDRPNSQSVVGSEGLENSLMEDDKFEGEDTVRRQNYLNSALEMENSTGLGNLGQIVSMPKPSGQSRSRGGERSRRDILTLEKKELDGTFDDVEGADGEVEDRDNFNIVEDDLSSKLAGLTLETVPTKPMRSDKPGFSYFCAVCKKHMNTIEAYKSHIQGKNHLHILSNSPAPARHLDPIKKTYTGVDLAIRVCGMINGKPDVIPRSYQLELVEKAMTGDRIIYLPTGTGKTLVAVLTMGLMLQENPSRPVLFLVDKVLLVLQQAQYIKSHFAGTLFRRQDNGQSAALVSRPLEVKPICGGLTTKTDLPVWRHDIVVTTAVYCHNMLDRGLIRWEDFSLVVLDEVHHCNKGHPYHRLISSYHSLLPEASRAKLLGLTASPAGKSTVELTYIMLKNLLTNLGGATVAVVETQIKVLDKFQSMAKVRAVCVPMTSKEMDFKCHLLEYFILCYSKIASMTTSLPNDIPPCSYFMNALDKPGDREVAMELAKQFIRDPEPLCEVLTLIYNSFCKNEANYELKNCFDNLKLHICQLLLVIPEVGSGTGIEELLKALSPSTTEEFKKMGLPCEQMFLRVQNFAEDGNNDLTMFNKLVETLQDPDVINWSDMSSRALVLVRERKRAKQYCHKLRGHPMVKNKNLRVGHIVGHGKGAKDGGMDVKKQRMVFDNHEKFHILVATSIMEEGIDIQALQLVVCMNPPNSLRALVQMRGRARRAGSHFIVLCSSQEEVEKLEKLQKQETHMLEATNRLLV